MAPLRAHPLQPPQLPPPLSPAICFSMPPLPPSLTLFSSPQLFLSTPTNSAYKVSEGKGCGGPA